MAFQNFHFFIILFCVYLTKVCCYIVANHVSSFSVSVKIINHKIHMKCFIWLRRQNLVIQKWRESFYLG